MVWLLLVFVCYVLSYSTVPVAGQCTVPSCAVSFSGSEESLQVSLEEHDHKLETMNQNMCSALEKLEEAVNRTNARGQEELCQDLKMLNESLSSALQTVNRNLDYIAQVMKGSVVGALRDHDQNLQTMNESLLVDKINERLNAVFDHANDNLLYLKLQVVNVCRNDSVVCDCSDIKANNYTTSGVYSIYVVDQGQRYYANVFCDMTTANGAWTVFQRRKDGSVDFYREWNDYANGFGNLYGEFWLGNTFLHFLTSKRRYRLRIDLEDLEGGKRYAEYSTFNISSSADKYRLRIGTYSGTAGDGLTDYSNIGQFSTKDSDNDEASSYHWAVYFGGAWWSKGWAYSNLNGLYLRGRYSSNGSFNGYQGIFWYPWHYQWYSLKTTEMKISSS